MERDRIDRERDFQNLAISEDLRRRAGKYYSVTSASKSFYVSTLERLAVGRDVLEIGCSVGEQAIKLARLGARVAGADVSTVALDKANHAARQSGLQIDFRLANAEEMPFADNRFDLIYGSGILHHLNLERICREMVRILKPNGSAVFYEPLGHNPLINLYRKLTPNLRSADEHPLRAADLRLISSFFSDSDFRYFHAFALATVPLRGTPVFASTLRMLDRLDAGLFSVLPYAQRFAWIVVTVLRNPTKSSRSGTSSK